METTENKEQVFDQAYLDDLMNQYNTPAKSLEPETPKLPENETTDKGGETPPGISPNFVLPKNVTDSDAPFGRFVKGPKKGQPKPKPGTAYKAPTVAAVPVDPNKATFTGTLIDGGLFLVMINLLFPMLIALGNNFFSDKKIDPKKLKLADDQIKELKPVAEKVLAQMTVKGNPMVILVVGLVCAFGINFMAVKMDEK